MRIQRPERVTPADRPSDRRFLSGPQSLWVEMREAGGIFTEYLSGLRALHELGPCVTVFGSARLPQDDDACVAARGLGAELARNGFTVMTGGGPGVMEAANRGAAEAGGRTAGCNILLPVEQEPNPYLDVLVTFRHFFIRKVMLVRYSSAFVAMAGGFGTYDEVFEAATLIQTGKIADFPIVLMGTEFWEPLVDVLTDGLVARGTIGTDDAARFFLTDSAAEAVGHIVATTGDR